MTSGILKARLNKPPRRGAPYMGLVQRCLKCLALAALLLASAAHAGKSDSESWNVEALMQLLSQHPSGTVQFTETKTLSVLDQTVVSSGELVYRAPDRLEKHTRQPKPESMVIEGNTLTLQSDGRQRQMRLPQYPELLAFVEALRGTLVGNQALLQQHYALSLSGKPAQWQLKLTPLDQRALRWVKHIVVSGAANRVTAVETQHADGDTSLIAITAPR